MNENNLMIPIRRTNSIWKSFFSCILVFFIAINVYTFPRFNIGFGEILFLISIPFLIFNNCKIVKNHSGSFYFCFLIYAAIISIIYMILLPQIDSFETVKRLGRDGFYIVLVFVFSRNFFEYRCASNVLNIFSDFLSIYIIVQFLAFLLFHVYVPGLIDGLPIGTTSAIEIKQTMLKVANIEGFLRPAGFLCEPAHCAQLLSTTLLLNIFPFYGKKSLKRIFLYSVALVCTTSVNAIVFLLVDYFLWALQKLRTYRKCEWINVILIGILLLVVGGVLYIKIPFVQLVVNRLFTIGKKGTSSASVRVMRGFAFFGAMPTMGKLFGMGFGNFLGYRDAFGIWTSYEMEKEYMAMDMYVVTSVGIIGTIILITAIYKGLKNKGIQSKCLMFLFLIMGLSSSVYSTPVYALILSFIFFGPNKYNDLKEKVKRHENLINYTS